MDNKLSSATKVCGASNAGGSSSADAVAAEWIVRRDRGLSPTEQEALNDWKNADPRNAAVFERVSRTWRGLDSIGGVAELETMANDFLARARSRRRIRRYVRF